MKKQLALIMLTMSALISNSHSKEKNIDGNWILKERICSDGMTPNDNFQIHRDRLQIIFSGNHYMSQLVIESKLYSSTGELKINGNELTTISKDGIKSRAFFTLTLNGELNLYSYGFHEGGSCLEGESLKQVFHKQ